MSTCSQNKSTIVAISFYALYNSVYWTIFTYSSCKRYVTDITKQSRRSMNANRATKIKVNNMEATKYNGNHICWGLFFAFYSFTFKIIFQLFVVVYWIGTTLNWDFFHRDFDESIKQNITANNKTGTFHIYIAFLSFNQHWKQIVKLSAMSENVVVGNNIIFKPFAKQIFTC